MSRKKECVRVFAGAAAFAYALYALTLPEGLPWGIPETLSGTWMVVALAAGLLGSLVTRYLGWRCGAAVALVFTCVPEVWNRAILGEPGMAFVASAVCGLWLLNAILLLVFRKAREARGAAPAAAAGAATAHDETQKRGKVNGIAAWVFLGIAALYAALSILLHDYKLGEPASVFARGVVEEAGERVVVLNGALDEQIERGLEKKAKVEGQELKSFLFVSLREDEENRTNVVAWAKREWPGETNLHLSAQVGVVAFLDAAVKAHPERFYLMNGKSTTLAGWEKRWEAFEPYLKSKDPFVSVARRLFGREGNRVANALLDEGEKAGSRNEELGIRNEGVNNSTVQPPTSNLQPAAAKLAWQLYKRIYEEIDSGNASALFNLNEMIRRGYKVGWDEKKWVTDKVDAFFKDEMNRRYIREIVQICGPVRVDPAVVEQLRQEAEKRTKERVASGEKVELPCAVKDVLEQNDKMVEAMAKDDRETAAKIAREILSKPGWRTWAPANAVMGEIMVDAGDYAAAESFFSIAIANEKETPDVVMNNYADVLMQLGKLDEAERILRELIAERGETAWGPRFTLAEVLTRKVKVRGEDQEKEVRELVAAVIEHAPVEVKKLVREKQRKGEILN